MVRSVLGDAQESDMLFLASSEIFSLSCILLPAESFAPQKWGQAACRLGQTLRRLLVYSMHVGATTSRLCVPFWEQRSLGMVAVGFRLSFTHCWSNIGATRRKTHASTWRSYMRVFIPLEDVFPSWHCTLEFLVLSLLFWFLELLL